MNSFSLRYGIKFSIWILAALLIVSCRAKRITKTPEPDSSGNAELAMISILKKKTHGFHTMKINRVDVDFSMNGVQDKVKGKIAIYRDSMIAVSIIPALGYEVFRILCTRDSVILINRPEKSYYADSFEYFKRKYNIPVGFYDMQAMLANEVFYYKENYGDRIYEKQLTTRKENNLFIVDAFRDGNRITNQGIEIDREGRRLENIFVVDYELKMKLNLDYEEFVESEGWMFPKNLRVDMVESNNTIQVNINYGQIVFDDSINVEFSVPEHYTREDL